MSDSESTVCVFLDYGSKIKRTNIKNGDISYVISIGKLSMIVGHIYEIPVKISNPIPFDLKFTPDGYINERMDIRNVRDNIAIIIPILFPTIITDGEFLGFLN